MSFWRPARYYCTNLAMPCHYAESDIAFTAQDFNNYSGRCRANDGCGELLVEGNPRDLRLRMVLAGVSIISVAVGLGWFVRTQYFPNLLRHLRFATAETRVEDSAGLIQLDVIRDQDTRDVAQVTYSFQDGSAKAGEDYQPVQSVLDFERGATHETIPVSVLPDTSSEKTARYFTVTLSNVFGSPRHIVHIIPHPVDRTVVLQVEQAVKAASRNGADVGTYMTKTEVLLRLLKRPDLGAKRAAEYQLEFDTVNGNLSRSREAYSQSVHQLLSFQAPLVMQTLDRMLTELTHQDFLQQARALVFVKAHLKELLDKHDPDVERWWQDLRTTVPRPDPAPRPPKSVAQGSTT